MKTVDIAKDFSPYPAGRYFDDGNYSGEAFRKQVLIPAMVADERVEIVLDNTRGYDSSFLEEAFGGLFRDMDIMYDDVCKKITFVTEDEFLRHEILSYMMDAHKLKQNS